MKLSRMLASAVALLLAVSVSARASTVAAAAPAFAVEASGGLVLALAQDPPKAEVEVTLKSERTTTTWFADPIWIIAGLIGAAIVIALVVAASRGKTTTVIR